MTFDVVDIWHGGSSSSIISYNGQGGKIHRRKTFSAVQNTLTSEKKSRPVFQTVSK